MLNSGVGFSLRALIDHRRLETPARKCQYFKFLSGCSGRVCFREGGRSGDEARSTIVEILSKMPVSQWLRGAAGRQEHREREEMVN